MITLGRDTHLGTFEVAVGDLGQPVYFSSPAFEDFVYWDDDGAVTFIITSPERNNVRAGFASRENASFDPPKLSWDSFMTLTDEGYAVYDPHSLQRPLPSAPHRLVLRRGDQAFETVCYADLDPVAFPSYGPAEFVSGYEAVVDCGAHAGGSQLINFWGLLDEGDETTVSVPLGGEVPATWEAMVDWTITRTLTVRNDGSVHVNLELAAEGDGTLAGQPLSLELTPME